MAQMIGTGKIEVRIEADAPERLNIDIENGLIRQQRQPNQTRL